jgi:hypothetical protein
MREPQKNPVWPWILVVLVGLPVLYVGSFGPACWLTSQVHGWSKLQPPRAMLVYFPLGAVASRPDTVYGRGLRWWMTFGVKRGHAAVVQTNAAGTLSIEVEIPY